MWALPPCHSLFFPQCFHYILYRQYDKMPKINGLKRVNVYFGSQFQPCWLQSACPCCFGAGEESVHHGRGFLFISWQLGSRQGLLGVLVHSNGVTSSNKVPL